MKNNKGNLIILAVVTIIVIAGIAAFAINKDGEDMDDKMMGKTSMSSNNAQADTKSADYVQYSSLIGDDYDRIFLANMIAHHQGAVDMANLALSKAKHQEIKSLASNIVAAQKSEISSMAAWQKEWGYPASSGELMMDHSSMGMMDSNASMMQAIESKSGDDFDKAFLIQMITHHQSALNMAATGKTNAKHQEVKDLTVAIVTAQTTEIKQMKQWQKDWGY